MLSDSDKPVVGSESKMLGVRGNGYDIPIHSDGTVSPQTGGLSVTPDWRLLPLFLIPRRLQSKLEDARGSNRLACFRLGSIPFQNATIGKLLLLRPDSAEHGTIEPSQEMQLIEFQDALAATRDLWVIDEN